MLTRIVQFWTFEREAPRALGAAKASAGSAREIAGPLCGGHGRCARGAPEFGVDAEEGFVSIPLVLDILGICSFSGVAVLSCNSGAWRRADDTPEDLTGRPYPKSTGANSRILDLSRLKRQKSTARNTARRGLATHPLTATEHVLAAPNRWSSHFSKTTTSTFHLSLDFHQG